jgi:type I restriction enzyme S subunit
MNVIDDREGRSTEQDQGVGMKKGWGMKTLGEVCEVFADGDWVESKDQSTEGIRLIQTGNVGEGVFKDRSEKARYISEATFKRLRCTEIVEGDCLVSRLPEPVGRSCILPDTGERMITAVDCTILRFNPKQLLPTFFNLYSQSDNYLTTVAKECTGTTRNRISRSNLGQTPIPVPPLPEQQRIVALLDEAFAGLATAKANAERNLQNARAIFESHLEAVFSQRGEGWVATTLGEIGKISMCKRIFKEETSAIGDIPFYKIGTFGKEPNAFIPYQTYREFKAKYSFPKKGDVLISASGTIGRRVKYDDEPAYFQDSNIVWIDNPESQVLNDYLYHFYGACEWNSTTGATIARLYNDDLRGIPIGFPKSLQKQDRIVAELNDLSKETQHLTRLYERKLAALGELKKSLLYQAFNGEL